MATTYCQLLFKLRSFICYFYDTQRAIGYIKHQLCRAAVCHYLVVVWPAVNFISLVEVTGNGQYAILLAGNVARDRIT